jgi:hypothetical protein
VVLLRGILHYESEQNSTIALDENDPIGGKPDWLGIQMTPHNITRRIQRMNEDENVPSQLRLEGSRLHFYRFVGFVHWVA